MMNDDRKSSLENLKQIPGVGDKTAEDLQNLGIRSADDLCGRDPEELYHELCVLQEKNIDRCMLYVFRCAVYYVSHDKHDQELLKWWNWKDREE